MDGWMDGRRARQGRVEVGGRRGEYACVAQRVERKRRIRTEMTWNDAPEIAPAEPKTRGTPVLFALGRVLFQAASVKVATLSNAPRPRPSHAELVSLLVGTASAEVAAKARVSRLRTLNMATGGGGENGEGIRKMKCERSRKG